ncbi:phospholipid carrier-dependent glycosyltransferase [Spirosoma taeanense]|uniref:Phospholipid carrier-dependent glycosyltransferase n=1 Tax=Spirosoma taeanense TaxID=2735870 RepID=A0A6M5YD05_9BACT|nr:glycosyltransferase family 39 protein [Spirosoma taeanense]QJW91141.1 phospholipid carrier-dependent glycosyltransferase [Spirosoma taeanense]
MQLLLPPIVFGSLWFIQASRYRQKKAEAPVRSGLLTASLLWVTLLIGLTEALSYGARLNASVLGWAWTVAAVSCVGWAGFEWERTGGPIIRRFRVNGPERVWLAAVAGISTFTLVTALVYPPNNFDSLAYHLGRISHWMQQQSVRPFATHLERELYQPPLSEWIMLHTMLLSGSDAFVNLVQWSSGLGCLAALSLLSRQLGGNRTTQVATVFVAATIPMVILQSSSTQNDVIVSFFLITLVVYLLRYYQLQQTVDLIWAGLALGCAFLTKGTAYLFAAPILLTWGLLEIARLMKPGFLRPLIRLTGASMLILGLGLLLNASHFSRNLRVYNNPLANSEEQSRYTNELFTPAALLSNVSRNLALHCQVPLASWVAQHSVETLHDWLELPANDSRTTYGGTIFDLPMLGNNEDNAANALHLLWLTGCVIWLSRTPDRRSFRLLAVLVFGIFLLFCAYLKWQPWHSRLHTTLFLLASPIGGLGLAAAVRHRPVVGRYVAAALVVSGVCFALTNPTRPLLTLPPLTQPVSFLNSRSDNYFVNDRNLLPFQRSITTFLNQQPDDSLRVGLLLGENDWDYIWYQPLKPSIRCYHIRVRTPSRKLDTQPPVNYIVSTQTLADTLIYNQQVFGRMSPKQDKLSQWPALFAPRRIR